jgi:Zn-finger protein
MTDKLPCHVPGQHVNINYCTLYGKHRPSYSRNPNLVGV